MRPLHDRAIAATLAGLAAAAGLFALRPEFDLALSARFFSDGQFASLAGLRGLTYYVPAGLMEGAVLLWALARFGRVARAPSGHAVLFLALTFALGPGLVANAVLKEYSGRPRPVQIVAFGGKQEFRPWQAFDGACPKNCSFVSGEASAAAWTLAPALIAPAPIRAAATIGALAFGALVGGMRIAQGGHFASDVLIGELLTILIVLLAARLMRLPQGPRAN